MRNSVQVQWMVGTGAGGRYALWGLVGECVASNCGCFAAVQVSVQSRTWKLQWIGEGAGGGIKSVGWDVEASGYMNTICHLTYCIKSESKSISHVTSD